jgi:hypothetical protein
MKTFLTTAILTLSLSAAVMAKDPLAGYLGQTSSPFDGDTNRAQLYAACQADYGEGALLCSTKDLFDSPAIAGVLVPGSGMWARPHIVQMSYNGATGNSVAVDYSGLFQNADTFNACATATSGNDANYITHFWWFQTTGACADARPAACCR